MDTVYPFFIPMSKDYLSCLGICYGHSWDIVYYCRMKRSVPFLLAVGVGAFVWYTDSVAAFNYYILGLVIGLLTANYYGNLQRKEEGKRERGQRDSW